MVHQRRRVGPLRWSIHGHSTDDEGEHIFILSNGKEHLSMPVSHGWQRRTWLAFRLWNTPILQDIISVVECWWWKRQNKTKQNKTVWAARKQALHCYAEMKEATMPCTSRSCYVDWQDGGCSESGRQIKTVSRYDCLIWAACRHARSSAMDPLCKTDGVIQCSCNFNFILVYTARSHVLVWL